MERDRLDEFMTLVVGASRSVTRLKGKYMAAYGLGSTHTMCIRKLYMSANGLTRTQLSEHCELDKAQVSRIVNELTEKGCVVESAARSSYNRRVTLTDEGRRIAEDINDIVLSINSFVSKDFSDEELAIFYKIFGAICENLKVAEDTVENDL